MLTGYLLDRREKNTAESNFLATQVSLRQLLRTFVVFCRFDVLNGVLLLLYPQFPFLSRGTEAKHKQGREALLDDAQLSMVQLCRGDLASSSRKAIDESISMKV